ncbi:LytTR family DNA-binding domain-containing protein [Aquimarina sp. AU474]|uniref:LytTR family DNA-binding domain-containing protein n=1 Tax=Aquimarina sp. AU474 TaxID=2108529 RepID=UPI000D68CC81|nr:LytTR family DNA-binding domain-containing protein [Aquimarina sp. AU474]
MYNRIINSVLSSKDKLIIPILFSSLAFLLLVLFQPFEYRSYTFFKTLGDSFLSAFLVLLATLFTRVVVPYFFYEQWRKENRKFINNSIEVLFDVILFLVFSFFINLSNGGFINQNYITWLGLSLKYVLIFEVLFIPLSLFVQYYFLDKPINDREDSFFSKQNLEVSLKPTAIKIRFTSKTEQEHIEIFPQDLIMIKSWGNYIEVFYMKDHEVVFSLLRNTLTNINNSIKEHPFLFQCHRSYVININRVLVIKGNARGYQLTIEGMSTIIPVSRSRISLFDSLYR